MNNEGKKRVAVMVGAVITTLALSVLGAVALEAFFSRPESGSSWPAAVSAMSTIVLVLITTIYMIFTGDMVKLQREANAHLSKQANAESVRKVIDMMWPAIDMLNEYEHLFPLAEKIAPNAKELQKLSDHEDLNRITERMRTLAVQLPHDLGIRTLQVATMVKEALYVNIVIHSLTIQVGTERLDALTKKLEHDSQENAESKRVGSSNHDELPDELSAVTFTWDEIRSQFYQDEETRKLIRPRLFGRSDKGLAEWSEVQSGQHIKFAHDAVDNLEDELRDWLVGS